jgi:hypothetical protein
MCDVLTQAEFSAGLTEMLLERVPALSGKQICDIRQGLLEFAKMRGWVDGRLIGMVLIGMVLISTGGTVYYYGGRVRIRRWIG